MPQINEMSWFIIYMKFLILFLIFMLECNYLTIFKLNTKSYLIKSFSFSFFI